MTENVSNVGPITALASSISSNPGVYVPLIGSGMSSAAGVPTGRQFVEALAREVIRTETGNRPTDVVTWWRDNRSEPLTYQSMIEGLGAGTGDRQALLRSIIEPSDEELAQGLKVPTRAHFALAELAQRGLVRVIVTTNFDRLIEAALASAGIESQLLAEPSDVEFMIPLQHSRCTVIKLHGDYQRTNLLNTDNELGVYENSWRILLARNSR